MRGTNEERGRGKKEGGRRKGKEEGNGGGGVESTSVTPLRTLGKRLRKKLITSFSFYISATACCDVRPVCKINYLKKLGEM